nr:MoaD/ThiS family protein [Saccharothrix sp.]
MELTVRYFAGARAAAGTQDENLTLPPGATVATALTAIEAKHGENLTRVLKACSFLLDGVAVRDHATHIPPGAQLDVLPPFAGG